LGSEYVSLETWDDGARRLLTLKTSRRRPGGQPAVGASAHCPTASTAIPRSSRCRLQVYRCVCVCVCWFYAKNCTFEHMTDKIFPVIFGDPALQVKMLEQAPGVDLAVCVGTGTPPAACGERRRLWSPLEALGGGQSAHDGAEPRQPLVEYTVQELLYLMDGVRRFGTSWTTILQNYAFNSQRTAADIKEKYGRIRKVCQLDYEYHRRQIVV